MPQSIFPGSVSVTETLPLSDLLLSRSAENDCSAASSSARTRKVMSGASELAGPEDYPAPGPFAIRPAWNSLPSRRSMNAGLAVMADLLRSANVLESDQSSAGEERQCMHA
jgi:hypothetical protein